MWYFTWILGLGLAAAFSILNAMWYEVLDCQRENEEKTGHGGDEPL
jgi:cyd operon protein YbgT